MAYPTTVDFKHTGDTLGMQPINETSATKRHPLGMVVTAKDTTYGVGEFVYAVGAASTAAGDLCCYDSTNGDTARAVAAGATSKGSCGAAMSANTAGRYGWYQIGGAGPVFAATVAADVPLYLTSTAGKVDDSVSSGELVVGLVSRAATSSDYATCQFDRPHVSALGGASGTNSGDVTLAAFGSTPAAPGASISGQVLTLQPASATHPGGIAAATYTALVGVQKFTLTPAAEDSDAIEVEGQISNLLGTAAAAAQEVLVRTLAVTSDKGDITIGAGADPGTLIEAYSPAAGVNEAWITTTATGHFRFIVTNDAAEDTLVQVSCNGAITATLKLTFA